MSIRQLDKIRPIHHSGERAAEARVESRPARIWEILPEQKLCRVKVQGIDDPIPVRYPRDGRHLPDWCKVRAPVTIRHIAGHRNRIEIIGPGMTVPTPEPGAAAAPDIAAGPDCVIEGCVLRSALSGMHVYFELGKYRINGVYYQLTENWVMGETPNLEMTPASPMQMGNIADVFELSAADSTRFRFDAFYVGIDRVIDYVIGTTSSNDPVIPAGPASHVKLGHVLVPPGITEPTTDLFNAGFMAPVPFSLVIAVTKGTLSWSDSSTTITATIMDQYGKALAGAWTVTATITSGSGSINATATSGGGSSTSFTYQRESPQGAAYEQGPVNINFMLVQRSILTNIAILLLEDEEGVLIYG